MPSMMYVRILKNMSLAIILQTKVAYHWLIGLHFYHLKKIELYNQIYKNYITKYKPEVEIPSKQFVSYQRSFIEPVLFQDINKKYLELIDYKKR